MISVNGKEVDVEFIEDGNTMQLVFTHGETVAKVDKLLGEVCTVEADGKLFESYEVSTIAMLRSTETDLWEGKRVTAVLREAR